MNSPDYKTRALEALGIAAIATLVVGVSTALAQQAGLKLHPLAQVGVAVGSGLIGSMITGQYVRGRWIKDDEEFPYSGSIPVQHEHHHHLSPAMQQAMNLVDSPPPPPSPPSAFYPALESSHPDSFTPPPPPASIKNTPLPPSVYPPSVPVSVNGKNGFTPPPSPPLRLDGMLSEVPVDFGQNGEFVLVGNGSNNLDDWD